MHTYLSELSAIIWVIHVYNSVLCTSTKHCVGKLLLLISVFVGGLVISVDITLRSHKNTTPIACLSPCTLAQSSFQQNMNVKLLFWAGSTFLGLNMKHMLTKLFYRHALIKKKTYAVSLPLQHWRQLPNILGLLLKFYKKQQVKNSY